MPSYKLFIGGKWVDSVTKRSFPSINPTTAKPLSRFQEGSSQDVELAVRAAKKAFPKWKTMPAPKRGEILLKVAELMRKHKQELGQCVSTEMGKVISEGLGDVQEAIDIFEYMAGEGRRLFGYTTPSELPEKSCFTMRMPLGIVGMITPWNFPIAIPAWKLAPALICGNTVVLKPSSDSPLCAVKLVEILEKAGVPPGVVNLVTGPGATVGTAIVRHREIAAISFTGSKETGEFIVKNAGLKKVGLELGGKNAIIVMDDADLDLALDGVVWGAFGTTGQRCTACSRLIIHNKVQKKFEKMLLEKIKKLKLGNPVDKKTLVGPLVNQRAVEKVSNYVSIGMKEGAKMLCGGKRRNPGYFYYPTVFSNVKSSMKIAQEEIFGPVLSVITVKSLEEAIMVCNDSEYGLSSAIYTQDVNSAWKAIDGIHTGITYVNGSTIGAEVHLPFGGVKGTGNGTREAGWAGLEEFSEIKTVYFDYSGKLQKAQIDD